MHTLLQQERKIIIIRRRQVGRVESNVSRVPVGSVVVCDRSQRVDDGRQHAWVLGDIRQSGGSTADGETQNYFTS